MRRRRFLQGSILTGASCLARATGAGAAPAGEPRLSVRGVFALAGATPKAESRLTVRYTGPTGALLDFFQWDRARGTPLTRYAVDMSKRMHVIVISDDFRHFEHVHPEPEARGVFALRLDVPVQGGYHVYSDSVPIGLGQQVFRYDLQFGSAVSGPPDLTPTSRTVHAGPYAVTLDTLRLRADATTMLGVRFTKNGRPAADLRPYLGGAAHAVFINARTLAYAHVHPFQGAMAPALPMPGMPDDDPPELSADAHLDPTMTLHVNAPTRGTYKLWLQFRGGENLYVAPFVLRAG